MNIVNSGDLWTCATSRYDSIYVILKMWLANLPRDDEFLYFRLGEHPIKPRRTHLTIRRNEFEHYWSKLA